MIHVEYASSPLSFSGPIVSRNIIGMALLAASVIGPMSFVAITFLHAFGVLISLAIISLALSRHFSIGYSLIESESPWFFWVPLMVLFGGFMTGFAAWSCATILQTPETEVSGWQAWIPFIAMGGGASLGLDICVAGYFSQRRRIAQILTATGVGSVAIVAVIILSNMVNARYESQQHRAPIPMRFRTADTVNLGLSVLASSMFLSSSLRADRQLRKRILASIESQAPGRVDSSVRRNVAANQGERRV